MTDTTLERPAVPEQRTVAVDVDSLDTRGRTVVGFAAVYDVLSEDLGGYRERISPGAFAGVLDGDVRALLNHDPNHVLGRTRSGTLRLADEQRGLRFELDLPDSPLGENVREAVRRGDLDGASFRFVVGDDDWTGDVRTVTRIAALHDVTIASYPAYPAAAIELRTRPAPNEETTMPEDTIVDEELEQAEEVVEQRTGSLRVADLNQGRAEARTILRTFRDAGWRPGRRAEVAWSAYEESVEMRALAFGAIAGDIAPLLRDAGPLGADQRYAWPAFPRVGVDAGTTSVDVLTQTARTLPAPASTIRAIDAVTTKPEVGSTIDVVTVPLKQVAAVVSGVPNVYLESSAVESILAGDLRLAVNEGLDKMVLDSTTASGFQPATPDLLSGIRKAITTIQASGYSPDTVILTPADAEALDLLTSAGPEAVYTFGAGRFAPGELFGLTVRVSKSAASPIVADATAFGRLYISPISLASFEENAGATNSSLLRLECHAAFGVERQPAAIRIAAA
jgi:HK97 family phage prohead protease